MRKHNTIVSVLMLTYNHEKYVETAIKSILCQKTNFCFELLIGEDCSTDNTRQIVIEYGNKNPDIIRTFLSVKNVGAIENEKKLMEMAQGKYIAFCEGDDYWTDEHKLQKQVDFLESNPDYGLVHGDTNLLNASSGELIKAYNKSKGIKIPEGDIFRNLMTPSHIIKTMTVCFNKALFEKYYLSDTQIMNKDWRLIDISIWLMIARHSKIHYFNEVFATYRLLPESMSRSRNPRKLYEFHKSIFDIKKYFLKIFNNNIEIEKSIYTSHYKFLLSDAYAMNDYKLANKVFLILKSNNIDISLKEKIMFLAVKYPFVRYLINIVK